jgi:hypothetical protein
MGRASGSQKIRPEENLREQAERLAKQEAAGLAEQYRHACLEGSN